MPKGGGQRAAPELIVSCPHLQWDPGKGDSFKKGVKFFHSSLDLEIFLIATTALLENMRR